MLNVQAGGGVPEPMKPTPPRYPYIGQHNQDERVFVLFTAHNTGIYLGVAGTQRLDDFPERFYSRYKGTLHIQNKD